MGKVEGLLALGAIIVLLFGAKQLPKLARSVGESVHELKKGLDPNAMASSGTAPSAGDRQQSEAQANPNETRVDG